MGILGAEPESEMKMGSVWVEVDLWSHAGIDPVLVVPGWRQAQLSVHMNW